jgi:hypothetical protein
MKSLARQIAEELARANHGAVYEPELSRLWPESGVREAEIAKFAEQHGWRLGYYKPGFCAIFDKRRVGAFTSDRGGAGHARVAPEQ